MTPSERLIARKLEQELEDGYDANTALRRVSNCMAISQKRCLTVWVDARKAALEPVPEVELV